MAGTKNIKNIKMPARTAVFAGCKDKITTKRISGAATRHKSEVDKLKEEIALLTSYACETVYRLRYDSMQYDYISPTITHLLGFSTEEMKKINFRSLIVETRLVTNGLKRVKSFEDLENIRKKGDIGKWQADYLMRTKDGSEIWVSDISSPWFDDSGTIIGSVGSLRNITDRIEAENRVREGIEGFANTDAITGTANRRQFFNEADREIKRINRTESYASMLLIDIDHFSKINCEYGKDISDRVLVEITKIIKIHLRDTDLTARLGGGEFGVLLPETSIQGAVVAAERIRSGVIKTQFVVGSDKMPVGCSVSIGASSITAGEEKESSDMYKEAGTRMFIARNTGSNQISSEQIKHH